MESGSKDSVVELCCLLPIKALDKLLMPCELIRNKHLTVRELAVENVLVLVEHYNICESPEYMRTIHNSTCYLPNLYLARDYQAL